MTNENPSDGLTRLEVQLEDQPADQKERRPGKRGGRREGAGRKPNPIEEIPIWMQVGVPLTPEELRQLNEMNLTPVQRTYRLLHPSEDADVDPSANRSDIEKRGNADGEPEWIMRKQYNFRIVLSDLSERQAILEISPNERRRRLLARPEGGTDIDDVRRGVWTKGRGTAELP